MKKILVIGASGRVGQALCKELLSEGYAVLPASLRGKNNTEKIDVRDYAGVEKIISSFKPDLVSHLAAMTLVDECELHPDDAFQINALGTENVALACQKHNIILHYMSTAGVFDGEKKELYTEYDDAIPKNVYGVTKLAGEKSVERLLNRYYITRSGWMIGGGETDSNFVGKIMRIVKSGKTHIEAVNDKFGTPTIVKDFAKQFCVLIKTNRFGLYHTVCKNTASRYDIAVKMKEILKWDSIKITPVSSDKFPLPAFRVRSEMLRDYKLDLLGLNVMRTWQEALEEYLVENFSRVAVHS